MANRMLVALTVAGNPPMTVALFYPTSVAARTLPMGPAYIGRNRWPNARLTFNGRCSPRTLRL